LTEHPVERPRCDEEPVRAGFARRAYVILVAAGAAPLLSLVLLDVSAATVLLYALAASVVMVVGVAIWLRRRG